MPREKSKKKKVTYKSWEEGIDWTPNRGRNRPEKKTNPLIIPFQQRKRRSDRPNPDPDVEIKQDVERRKKQKPKSFTNLQVQKKMRYGKRSKSKKPKRTKRSRSRRKVRFRRPSKMRKLVRKINRVANYTRPIPLKERVIVPYQSASDANKCQYSVHTINRWDSIATLLADAFTIVDDGSTHDINMAADNKNKQIFFGKTRLKAYFRNNSNLPMTVYTWWLSNKKDMTVDPLNNLISTMDNIANADSEWEKQLTWWPGDCKTFKRYYKMSNFRKFDLEPGGEFKLKYFAPPFTFDSELYNRDTTIKYRKNSSCSLLIRIQGRICHDSTTTTLVGISPSSLDGVMETHYTFSAKTPDLVTRYQLTNSLDTVSNLALFNQQDPAEESKMDL